MMKVSRLLRERPVFASVLVLAAYIAPSIAGMLVPAVKAVLSEHSVLITCLWDMLSVALCLRVMDDMHCEVGGYAPTTPCVIVGSIVVLSMLWLIGNVGGTVIVETIGDDSFISYQSNIGAISTWSAIAFAVVVAPAAEELVMRGVIYRALRGPWVPVAAALASAIAFAVIHGTLVHLPMTFMLGLAMCCLLEMFGDVRWCILAHALINLATYVVLPYVHVPGWFITPMFASIGFICIVLIMLVVLDMLGRVEGAADTID